MVFALALVLGCISPAAPPQENNSVANTSSCRTVVTNEPYNDTACQNVSSMGQVCDTVVLNYSVSNTAKSEICVDKSLCAATDAFGNCISYYCSQGMTRCSVNITNMDPQKTADWSVAATFKTDRMVFNQNPVKKTILPLETATFDFQQMYGMDINQKRPSCNVSVAVPPKIQACAYITTLKEECHPVTSYREVQKQVCS